MLRLNIFLCSLAACATCGAAIQTVQDVRGAKSGSEREAESPPASFSEVVMSVSPTGLLQLDSSTDLNHRAVQQGASHSRGVDRLQRRKEEIMRKAKLDGKRMAGATQKRAQWWWDETDESEKEEDSDSDSEESGGWGDRRRTQETISYNEIIFGGTKHQDWMHKGAKFMYRPEQLRTSRWSEKGWESCLEPDGCFHGCDKDCPYGDYADAMMIDVGKNPEFSKYALDVWVHCTGSGYFDVIQFDIKNGKLTIYLNDVEIQEESSSGKNNFIGKGVNVVNNGVVRVVFEPLDPSRKSYAQIELAAMHVSTWTDGCMTSKLCLNKLGSTPAGYGIRNANAMQLGCLDAKGPNSASTECAAWKKCLAAGQSSLLESMSAPDYLQAFLRASLTNSTGVVIPAAPYADTLINPAMQDPETWECQCLESMKKTCKDLDQTGTTQCFKEILCGHCSISKGWKSDHCQSDWIKCTSSLIQEGSDSIGNLPATLAARQKISNTGNSGFDESLTGKCAA